MKKAIIVTIALAALSVGGWRMSRKRPFVSDAEKMCFVTQLAHCPEERLVDWDACEVEWLQRALWLESSWEDVVSSPRIPEDNGSELRRMARALAQRAARKGLATCPKAEQLDGLADAEILCSEAAYSTCIRPDADRSRCATLDIRTQRGRKLRSALEVASEARVRGELVETFVKELHRVPYCRATELLGEALARFAEQAKQPAKGPPGRVAIEAPAFDGDLDPSIIVKIVRHDLPAVQACFESTSTARRTKFGRLAIRWVISRSGATRALDVDEDSFRYAPLTACVKRVIAGLHFPAPPSDVEVSFPFVALE